MQEAIPPQDTIDINSELVDKENIEVSKQQRMKQIPRITSSADQHSVTGIPVLGDDEESVTIQVMKPGNSDPSITQYSLDNPLSQDTEKSISFTDTNETLTGEFTIIIT